MTAPALTAHRSPDGLLVFAVAACTIGLFMVCSAVELVPTGRPAQHATVVPSEVEDSTSAASARPLATARRSLAQISMLGWGRALSEPPNPRHRGPSNGDPRDELLALAALQRRWGLPSESYAAGTFGS